MISLHMRYRIGFAALMAVSLLLTAGCGKKKDPTRPSEARTLSEQGWELFAQEDYAGALAKFDAALDLLSEHPDANHGRGWTLAYLGDFHESRFSLVLARDLDRDNPDVWAGGAFVFSALDIPDEVVFWAEEALAWDEEINGVGHNWSFSRKPSINHLHLRWVLAKAYLTRGSYSQCASQLDILESGVQHSTDPQSLLADLQRLYSLFPSPF